MEKIIIEKEKAGKRIDIFISEQKQISRETAKRWIEQENVTINNKKVKPSYKTQENDIINIEPEEIKDIELKAQNIPLEVLYQDNDILVVNKPKGMVVHPANGNPDGTLVNAVMALCKDTLSGIGGELRPGIVHRLDKDTSGAIIIAKNDKSHIQLSEMLKNHEIEKTYIALVRGIVKENEATINMPISRSQNDRKKMAVHDAGGIMSEIMEAEGWKVVPLEGTMETVGYVIRIAVEDPAFFFGNVLYDKIRKVNCTEGGICFRARLNVPDAVRILYHAFGDSYIVVMHITAF